MEKNRSVKDYNNKKIIDRINLHCNDYSEYISKYRKMYGYDINKEPYESLYTHSDYNIDTIVSIIIPSWNSNETLLLTLQTIQYSNICKFHNDKLEVIIIDDGSDIEFSSYINENNKYPFCIKIVKQKHQGRTAAINNGVLNSIGDILVFMDSDILLYPYSLDELIKRQLMLGDHGIAFGFREDKDKNEIDSDNLERWLFSLLPYYWLDNRFTFDTHDSWGSNMMLETHMLLKRCADKNIWLCDGHEVVESCWQFYRMVYGFLFSVTRKNFILVGGFDNNLKGWGWEDSLFVAKCISTGVNIIPVPSACSIHIYHPARSRDKWKEAEANYILLTEILGRCEYPIYSHIETEVDEVITIKKNEQKFMVEEYSYTQIEKYLNNHKGYYYYQLGRVHEAKEEFQNKLPSLDTEEFSAYMDCLIRLGCKDTITNVLSKYNSRGLFISCLAAYISGRNINDNFDYNDPNFRHCYKYNPYEHLKRADIYFHEGQYYLALRDYFAFFIGSSQVPDNLKICKDIFRDKQIIDII